MAQRILLVCKETQARSMHFLAKLLREDGHDIAAFFIMPHEALLDRPDYTWFSTRNPDIEVFDTESVGRQYLKAVNRGTVTVSGEFLETVEGRYSTYKTLAQQTFCSQLMSSYAHYRDYYDDVPWKHQLYFMQLYYGAVEEMLDTFKPDVIYDSDTAEHGRAVLLEVAHSRDIPYVSIQHGRFRDYRLPTLTLSSREESWLYEDLDDCYQEIGGYSSFEDSPGYRELHRYRQDQDILATGYKGKHDRAQTFDFVYGALSAGYQSLTVLRRNIGDWWRYFRHVTTPLFSDPIKRALHKWYVFWRRVAIHKGGVFKRLDLREVRYVLFPLHMVPESSTFTSAPFYVDEEFLIASVSKSLEPDQWLVVKEHPVMLGERPISFYRRISRIPNVIVVDPTMFSDPREYIEHSEGVVTITGTSAFEASLLGRPSVVFGPTPHGWLSSVYRCKNIEELPDIIGGWKSVEIDDRELAAYIEYVMGSGRTFVPSVLRGSVEGSGSVMKHAEALYDLLRLGAEKYRRER